MEPYKTFVVPLNSTKLNRFMRNDSVTLNKEKNITSDDEQARKDSESSSDKGEKAKEKYVSPISENNTLPKEYIKTQKVTNAPNLISQSEPPSPKEIMVEKFELIYLFFPEQQELV